MNIVLIGYRGAGKSTAGKMLAARSGRKFMDADDLIEKEAGASILDIVRSKGWEHFRLLEERAIEIICRGNDLIIAPGGGAVLSTANVKALRRNGIVIWLKAESETLRRRTEKDTRTQAGRPTLTGKGTLAEFKEVLDSRNAYYARAADAEVDTSNLTVEEVVERILSIVGEIREG